MYRNQVLWLFAVISIFAVACASAAQPTPASNRITVEEVVNRLGKHYHSRFRQRGRSVIRQNFGELPVRNAGLAQMLKYPFR